MNRRQAGHVFLFAGLGSVATSLAASAQTAGKVYHS